MWLAIYVPGLPLQAFSGLLDPMFPTAVFSTIGRRDLVVACNRAANRAGVKVNTTLAEAHALTNHLVSVPRDTAREADCLDRLAHCLAPLTPNIHLSASFGLLLEVSGSLAMFGGCAPLLERAITLLEPTRLRTHTVLAPTARGARWLTQAHRQLIVEDAIADWLDELPVACMDVASDTLHELRELNLHRVGALRSLPSTELEHRFGPGLTLALDQAYGKRTQSLPWRSASPCFHEYVEFLDLSRAQMEWWPGIAVLLRQLQSFLRLRGLAATTLQWQFSNGSQQSTGRTLVAAEGTQLPSVWQRLLSGRLEREPITHELSRIDLLCSEFESSNGVEQDFFDQGKTQASGWQALLDLFGSRLGWAQLRRSPRHPHTALPESQPRLPAETTLERSEALRPVWLLDPPRLLRGDSVLRLRQSLNLRLPERVELYDAIQSACQRTEYGPPGRAAQRDYYIAAAEQHRYWWVYRDRTTDQWFLQGVFA